MLKLIYFALCIAGMIGFFYLCRWVVYSTTFDFAMGLGTGVAATVTLFYVAEKVQSR
jgi:hypothetical protein